MKCSSCWNLNRFIVLLATVLQTEHYFQQLAVAQTWVKYLPGLEGPLPFELETGYIGMDESEDVQLFYYFIKSEGNPNEDPLILWINGGPGCSGLTGLMLEIGPITIKDEEYNGDVPKLILNSESWTKVCSILFIDLPVGSGFSYAKTQPFSSVLSDTKQAHHAYQFLRKWLTEVHPEFLSNPTYMGGDSYAGIPLPVLTQEISNGNERGVLPKINLQGYLLGNPLTDPKKDNVRVRYCHGMGIVSDELYESWKKNCNGEYHPPNLTNVRCQKDLETFDKLTSNLEPAQILLPKCELVSPRSIGPISRSMLGYYGPQPTNHPLSDPTLGCPTYKYLLCQYWANHEDVREALHIRKGTLALGKWKRCNRDIPYDFDVDSSFKYHANLSRKGYRSLIYSGDHDMIVPFLGTQDWVRSLNYPIVDEWRPWTVGGQVAGYTKTYSNRMTFATVKGAGHTAPEYKPKQCLAMITRWLAGGPL